MRPGESRMRGQLARPVREGGQRKRTSRNADTAPLADPTTTLSSSTTTGADWSAGGCLKASRASPGCTR
jgi:hypothetical protein